MLKGKKIFIVEDNAMNRTIYMIILTKSGCHVEFDRLGRQTIKKLSEQPFDIIILDLMIPHGDSGYTIYDKVRALPQYQNVPIIAVSASEPAITIPKVQDLGFDGFIAKPLDKELFPQQLEQLLQGEKVWFAGTRF